MALQRRSRGTAAVWAQERGRLAAVLVARRQELSLTQTDLADLAGVGRGAIVAAEQGRAVSLDVLLSVLQALGLHLEVVRGAGSPGTPRVEVGSELATRYALDAEQPGE